MESFQSIRRLGVAILALFDQFNSLVVKMYLEKVVMLKKEGLVKA